MWVGNHDNKTCFGVCKNTCFGVCTLRFMNSLRCICIRGLIDVVVFRGFNRCCRVEGV
jgi:hypothetical protein